MARLVVERSFSLGKAPPGSSQVDLVFNNAGYGMAGPLEGSTDEQIVRIVDTNLMGPIRTTKAFIPHFREKRAGMFINTTSIGGLITVPFNSLYHATKWALEGWSESMAFELNQLGIGMKTIEPGGMKTEDFARIVRSDAEPSAAYLTPPTRIHSSPKPVYTPALRNCS